jgi:WhiB family transcriptional regulator, redox-sensing transcriptional regulator
MLPVASRAGALGWMSRGACRQMDPELFFPVAAGARRAARQAATAKAVCGRCAVRADCLSYALEIMPEGIWGGTTQDERRAGLRPSGLRAGGRSRGMGNAAMTAESAVLARPQRHAG